MEFNVVKRIYGTHLWEVCGSATEEAILGYVRVSLNSACVQKARAVMAVTLAGW